jgi:hypothetical protein
MQRQSDIIAVVSRERKRPLVVLIVALLAAMLLAACGGSDSDSTSGSTAGDSTTETQGGQNGGGSANSGSDGTSSENVATPLKVSGGGSKQFLSKDGDNSIQESGEEVRDESELREVAEIVHGFYVARAEEEWDTACSYLTKSVIEQLEQISQEDTDCATALEDFTQPVPAAVDREITTIDAGALRLRKGELGFLLYYGANRDVYVMPLEIEDGDWKVASLSSSLLS